ncbi:hypothetical protein Rhe02_75450 [Rhizocola hellebori]|uniref:Uncharacterized protein n=2 Tax=Rhizocola hellebori TaxID=1392758 RepID=A0A8J3VKW1_9ACTN|nr:hypothetical protein Rhe02_75450 [Rhizocola hellebori]
MAANTTPAPSKSTPGHAPTGLPDDDAVTRPAVIDAAAIDTTTPSPTAIASASPTCPAMPCVAAMPRPAMPPTAALTGTASIARRSPRDF